jgi:hypothetical protein
METHNSNDKENSMGCKTGTLDDPSFACACENCFEGMRVSTTLDMISTHGMGGASFQSFLNTCYDDLGFDLDDFMFEIWKDTLNDY